MVSELFYEAPDPCNLISGVSAHYIPHQISISFPFHGFFVSGTGNGYWFWESDTINYLFFTIIKRMELMLYYWAYFCKTILSICMNGLKNMFSSGWKISELACCFLGRVNIDGSFCYSWFCNKATKPQRYCFLFCVFLIS